MSHQSPTVLECGFQRHSCIRVIPAPIRNFSPIFLAAIAIHSGVHQVGLWGNHYFWRSLVILWGELWCVSWFPRKKVMQNLPYKQYLQTQVFARLDFEGNCHFCQSLVILWDELWCVSCFPRKRVMQNLCIWFWLLGWLGTGWVAISEWVVEWFKKSKCRG